MSDQTYVPESQSSVTRNTRKLDRLPKAALSLLFAFVVFQQPNDALQRPNGTERSQSPTAAIEDLPLDEHERGLVKAMADAIFRNGVVSRRDAEQLAEASIRQMRTVERNRRLASGTGGERSVGDRTVSMASKQDADPVAAEVLAVDREYQRARVWNDVAAIDRILSAAYEGTDKFGDRWGKQEVLQNWAWVLMESIETTKASVRFCGDDAIVEGQEIQAMPHRTDHLLFTRVYRRGGPVRWQLVTNTQAPDPQGQ
jgi:Domain of unknown function (DUF4440)